MKVVIEAPGKKEIKLNLFDNHTFQDKTKLWDLLEMASSRFVSFLVKQDPDPKFPPTIIRVLKIHNIEFGEDKRTDGAWPRHQNHCPQPTRAVPLTSTPCEDNAKDSDSLVRRYAQAGPGTRRGKDCLAIIVPLATPRA